MEPIEVHGQPSPETAGVYQRSIHGGTWYFFDIIAQKAIGYGIEPIRADGNDALAVYRAVEYAADKARRGNGPTFVELVTYRVSAHSSSDDPSRYRDESVTEEWRGRRDPIRRLEAYLMSRGWLAAGERERISEAIEVEVRDAIARQEAVASPTLATLIEDVFERPTWLLREQLAELESQPRAKPTHAR